MSFLSSSHYTYNSGAITAVYSKGKIKQNFRGLGKGLFKVKFLCKTLHLKIFLNHSFCAGESCWTDNSGGKGFLPPQGKGKYRQLCTFSAAGQ